MKPKQYIQNSLMLTTDDWEEAAKRQQEIMAKMYGLTLDEYLQAVASGSLLTPLDDRMDHMW